MALYHACVEGRPEPQPTDPQARIGDALGVAALYDADLFRAWLEIASVQTLPGEIMARPGIVDPIMEVASTHKAVTPPGPSRAGLLRMLAGERKETLHASG